MRYLIRVSMLPAGFMTAGLMVAGLMAAPSAGFAETPKTAVAEEAFADWRMTCLPASLQPRCQMVQSVSLGEARPAPFLLTITARSGQEASYGVITVPVGVYLAPGIEIVVDGGRPYKVLYELCDRQGCYAGFRLEEPLLSSFRSGASARFRVWTAKTRAVEFPVSLKGFTAGWRAFQRANEE